MSIEWETPAPAKKWGPKVPGSSYDEFFVALQEHPGRWAVFPGLAQSVYSAVSGYEKRTKRGPWERTMRGTKRQGFKSFVRYTGPMPGFSDQGGNA